MKGFISISILILVDFISAFIYDEIRTELTSGIESVEEYSRVNVSMRCTLNSKVDGNVSRILVNPDRFELQSRSPTVPLLYLDDHNVTYKYVSTNHFVSFNVKIECPSGLAPYQQSSSPSEPIRCSSCRLSPLISVNEILGKHLVIMDESSARALIKPLEGYEKWIWLTSLYYLYESMSLNRFTEVFVTHTSHPHGVFIYNSELYIEDVVQGNVIKEETLHISQGMVLLIHPVMIRVQGVTTPGSVYLSVYCQTDDDDKVVFRSSNLVPITEDDVICPIICSGNKARLVLDSTANTTLHSYAFANARVEWHSIFEYVVRSRLKTVDSSLNMLHSVFDSEFQRCKPADTELGGYQSSPMQTVSQQPFNYRSFDPQFKTRNNSTESIPWKVGKKCNHQNTPEYASNLNQDDCASARSNIARDLYARSESLESADGDFYDFYYSALKETISLSQPDSPCYKELAHIACSNDSNLQFISTGDSYVFNIPFVFCYADVTSRLDVVIDRGQSYHSNESCHHLSSSGLVTYNPLASLMQLSIHDVPMLNFVDLWDSRDMLGSRLQSASAEWLRDPCKGEVSETALISGCDIGEPIDVFTSALM